jgi:ferredoxin-NADP reductase
VAKPLLFVAGGSGITAVRSLLRAALRRRDDADVVLLYYARRRVDFAFADDLAELAARHPRCRVHLLAQQPDEGRAPAGRFSAAHLAAWAPDHALRDTFVCGPPGLMQAVTGHWAAAGLAHALRKEAFVPVPAEDAPDRVASRISFRRSARTVESTAPTLLAIAEGAGLRPPAGCRMGICRTCTCTKLSGTVRDRVTGAVDSAAGSRIRICVSEPLGAVSLDL